MLHPFSEVHPDEALPVHRRPSELVAVRGLHVLEPHVGEREATLAEAERGEEPLEESLRLVPVLRPRRAAVPLALYAYAHRPASALLALEVAHSFFSCHDFVLSFPLTYSLGMHTPLRCAVLSMNYGSYIISQSPLPCRPATVQKITVLRSDLNPIIF